MKSYRKFLISFRVGVLLIDRRHVLLCVFESLVRDSNPAVGSRMSPTPGGFILERACASTLNKPERHMCEDNTCSKCSLVCLLKEFVF